MLLKTFQVALSVFDKSGLTSASIHWIVLLDVMRRGEQKWPLPAIVQPTSSVPEQNMNQE